MASVPLVIFAEESGGRLGILRGDTPEFFELSQEAAGTPTPSLFEQVAQALGKADVNPGDVSEAVLCVPPQWCFSAFFQTDDLPRGNRQRNAMLYRFEQALPVAAEELACDFVMLKDGAFGVAGLVQKIKPLVDDLESHGIRVHHITCASLLGLQMPPKEQLIESDIVLWKEYQRTEIILLSQGRPSGWYLTYDVEDLSRHLRLLAARKNLPLRLCAVGSTSSDEIKLDASQFFFQQIPAHPQMLSASAGAEMLAGKLQPWVDLRKDALAPGDPHRQIRRPLNLAFAACALLLIAVCVMLLWRSHRYEQITRQNEGAEQAIFAEALPGRALPLNVRLHLASEEHKLRALSGDTGDAPQSVSSLALLLQLLEGLPKDLRYRVLEVRLDKGSLYLEGQGRTHADADTVAGALRDHSFLMDAPHTDQLADNKGVSFTITGTSPQASDKPKEARP